MKTYYVVWLYIANHSTKPWEIKAESAEQAAQKLIRGFSDAFSEKGKVMVFEQPPVYTYEGSKYA